ncbi:hypothetical protein D3C72_1524470 [compost metagenome]
MRRGHRRCHRLAGDRPWHARDPLLHGNLPRRRQADAGHGHGPRGGQAAGGVEGGRLGGRQRGRGLAHRRAGVFRRRVRCRAAQRRRHPCAQHRAVARSRPCAVGRRSCACARWPSRGRAHGLRRLWRAAGRCGQRARPGAAQARRADAGTHPVGRALRRALQSGGHDGTGVEPARSPGPDARCRGARRQLRCADPAVGQCLPCAPAA